MLMNAVLWGYIQFRMFEKNTLEVFIIFFEFRNCRTIQMNMLFAAICLLFKSKAGLGSKPKSLWLFAVCVALAEMLSLLLSCFIKVGAKPLAGLGLQNPRIFKIQKKVSAAPHAPPYFCLQQQKYAKMPPRQAQSLENLCRFANS